MTFHAGLEVFLQTHRPHGQLTWWTTSPTPKGYSLRVTCPCGVVFERWVLPQDAEKDLLWSIRWSFSN